MLVSRPQSRSTRRLAALLCASITVVALSLIILCFPLGQELHSADAASLKLFEGTPYGVGVIETTKAKMISLGWHSDRVIGLSDANCKIWLPAVESDWRPSSNDDITQMEGQDAFRIYFLYSEQPPSGLEMVLGKEVIKIPTVSEVQDDIALATIMRAWWTAFCGQSRQGMTEALRRATEDLLSVLGRHLGLPVTTSETSNSPLRSGNFESQFEKTLGMLLGFESVRLAMMLDETSKSGESRVRASLPVPNSFNIASVPIPISSRQPQNEIEPIAKMVPNDCFYVRCKTLKNYSWLRKLLMNWGGSLEDIIASPSVEPNVRLRLEMQLGIDIQQSTDALLDTHLHDLAVVGSDLQFNYGAGVGVLLEALPGHESDVERIIESQRSNASKWNNAKKRHETWSARRVTIYESDDQSMRSFCMIQGRFLLVTNSKSLAESFAKIEQTKQSLGVLPEFAYAHRDIKASTDSEIKIYLSDPFFRRITSARSRIEASRRRMAAHDCCHLELAAMIARSFGFRADTVSSLVQAQFLAPDFGQLPDGSHSELVDGVARNSMRGRVGSFVPMSDIATTNANQDEVVAYDRFLARYRQEWRAMDPVLVRLDRNAIDDRTERVLIDVYVAPYARQAYSFLSSFLAPSSTQHARLKDRSLVGVTAHLRSGARDYLAHFGLFDDAISYSVEKGVLVQSDSKSSLNPVNQCSFAAVTPSGTDGLQLLAMLVKSLQSREMGNRMIVQQRQNQEPGSQRPIFDNRVLTAHKFLNPAELLLSIGEKVALGVIDLSKANSISQDATWSIYGMTTQMRDEVLQLLELRKTKPAQIQLRAGGVDQSRLAPYLHAFSYCAARQQSAANAAWLTQWSSGLRYVPEEFRSTVESALSAKLICPLGGRYIVTRNKGKSYQWTSTAWKETSLADVSHVPTEYRNPFLHWLKRIELDFRLDPDSLNANAVLEVTSDPSQPVSPNTTAASGASRGPMARTRNESKSSERAFGSIETIVKNTAPITNVAHMHRGKYAVSVGADQLAHIWDLRSRAELQTFRWHTDKIWTVAVSPDGDLVATGGQDKTLRIWEVKTGKELGRVSATGIFSCVRFSLDGKRVLSTNWDGEMRIFDIQHTSLHRKFTYGEPILDIAELPSRDAFVLGTEPGILWLCDLQTGNIKLKLEGHKRSVHSLAVVDSTQVLSASHDRTLRLWDLSTGAFVRTYEGHAAEVHEVRMMSTGDRFISSSADGTVRLWDINSSKSIGIAKIGHDVRGISIAPDGNSVLAACSDGGLRQISLSNSP